jgi:hypothetical protein
LANLPQGTPTARPRLRQLEATAQIAQLDSLEGKDGKTVHKALHTAMVGHNYHYAQSSA